MFNSKDFMLIDFTCKFDVIAGQVNSTCL